MTGESQLFLPVNEFSPSTGCDACVWSTHSYSKSSIFVFVFIVVSVISVRSVFSFFFHIYTMYSKSLPILLQFSKCDFSTFFANCIWKHHAPPPFLSRNFIQNVPYITIYFVHPLCVSAKHCSLICHTEMSGTRHPSDYYFLFLFGPSSYFVPLPLFFSQKLYLILLLSFPQLKKKKGKKRWIPSIYYVLWMLHVS